MIRHWKPAGLAAFRYREYRLFWIAAAFSNIGMWSLVNGRLWLMHQLTDSGLMLGLVTFSSLAPILALSVWGGVVADRVDRLKLVMFTRGMFAALAFLTGALVATHAILAWELLAISLATGVLLSFDIPSRQAITPNLVSEEDLPGAIAMYSFVTTGSAVLGPMFFAPLVRGFGISGLFFLIGGAYVMTVVFLRLMRPVPQSTPARDNNLWRGLVEGLGYLRGHRTVRALIGVGIVVGIFGVSYETILPLFADQALGGGVSVYGNLLLGGGIGALLGAVLLASVRSRALLPRLLLVAGIGFGGWLILLAQVHAPSLAILIMVAAGASATLYMTTTSTLVQTLVDDRYRGRVMSVHQWTWGSVSLGGLLLGGVAQASGPSFALALGGVVVASAVVLVAVSALREFVFKPDAIESFGSAVVAGTRSEEDAG